MYHYIYFIIIIIYHYLYSLLSYFVEIIMTLDITSGVNNVSSVIIIQTQILIRNGV
jgi:hypothetical protein